MNENVFTPENTIKIGKPVDVYVNGNKIKNVCYADTKKGVVIFAPVPMRIKKNSDEVYTRLLRGHVEVRPCGS